MESGANIAALQHRAQTLRNIAFRDFRNFRDGSRPAKPEAPGGSALG